MEFMFIACEIKIHPIKIDAYIDVTIVQILFSESIFIFVVFSLLKMSMVDV